MRTERQRQYNRNHYQANKEQYLERNRRRKYEIIAHVRDAKDGPCVDCGAWYPYYVMDFDHVRGEKRGELSKAHCWGSSIAAVQREIDKCDLVCSNCHRERTYQRALGSQAQVEVAPV